MYRDGFIQETVDLYMFVSLLSHMKHRILQLTGVHDENPTFACVVTESLTTGTHTHVIHVPGNFWSGITALYHGPGCLASCEKTGLPCYVICCHVYCWACPSFYAGNVKCHVSIIFSTLCKQLGI